MFDYNLHYDYDKASEDAVIDLVSKAMKEERWKS